MQTPPSTSQPDSLIGFLRFLVESYGLAMFGLIAVLILIAAGMYVYERALKPFIASMLEGEKLRSAQVASMAQLSENMTQTVANMSTISKTNETIASHLLAATERLQEAEQSRTK